MSMYDVAIVGAGPVGSFMAKELADEGFSVVFLEEHDVIGKPIHCTGVIGASSYRNFDLPLDGLQNKIPDIRFISPQGQDVKLHNPNHWAYIVCRHQFDLSIAQAAQAAGAELRMETKVEDVVQKDDYTELRLKDGQTIQARYAVLATGSTSKLPYKLGFYRPWYFLKSAQIETEVQFDDPNLVDVFLGTKVSGGEFIWVVPVDAHCARIGIFSRYNAFQYLNTFLQRDDIAARIPNEYNVSRSVIPIGGLDEKDVKYGRIFTVGDAAGHVKPTSAGGIIFGMTSARILKDCLKDKMTRKGADVDIAKRYYRKVRRRLGVEIVVGDFFRSLFSQLEDADWNEIIQLAQDPELYDLIQKNSEFDKHSKIIKWALTNKDYRRIFFQKTKHGLLPMIKKGVSVWI